MINEQKEKSDMLHVLNELQKIQQFNNHKTSTIITKPITIILLFAVAIALWLCESDNIALFLATKAVALGITIGTCKLYDKWEQELNKPVQ